MNNRQNILPLLIALALISCGKGDKTQPGTNVSTSASDSAQLAPPPAAPAPVQVDSVPADPVVTQTAVITTDSGAIEVDLYGIDAPKTVQNFVGLAGKKFYNGIAFHRVIPGYVIQAGDPLSKDTTLRERWGTSGETIYGAPFEDELNPASPSGKRGYVDGVLAMANAGPNTNRSQFFIVFGGQQAKMLPYKYTIFGMVRKGMEVAHKIEVASGGIEKPQNPVRIKSITVKEAPGGAKAGDATNQPTLK